MYLYLDLDDYLAQWFIHDMGGEIPVRLKRGCMESTLLETYLTTPPADYVPEVKTEGVVPIVIPNFRNKDPRSNFYLPPKARTALKLLILQRFDLDMWNSLYRFNSSFTRQDKMIEAFMEKSGIEFNDKNYNSVSKRYQRKRDIYKRGVRRQKNRKK